MKFLLINYEFPPLGGGSSTASQNICKNIANFNHKILVLTSHFKNLPYKETTNGYEIHRIKTLRKKVEQSNIIEMFSFILCSIFPCIKLIKQFKPDCIFAFFSIPGGLIALILNLLFKTPYIVFLRGGDVPGFDAKDKILNLFHFFTRPLIRYICKKAHSVVANSEGLRLLALKEMPELEVLAIPNGVATDVFYPLQKNNENSLVRVICTGRLVKQKGFDLLMQSLKTIPSELWKLEIIGDGPEKQNLQILAEKLEIKDKVLFGGWIARENIVTKYQNADIFVLPSSGEGMSNTVLEAISSGLPVISTKVSGNDELIKKEQNGILIPVNNINALKNALERLINDPVLRTKMGEQSRKIALEYDWKIITKKLLQIITI